VERYAFRRLDQLLLFPYRRDGDEMRLLRPAELAALPLTAAYLAEHEAALRGREGGRMDHDEWYAYVYPKSLGHHDLPKLGVAATVQRLEIAADLAGAIYFHNVRVNGILASETVSLPLLLVLLNSRLLDWVFRRGAADHANDYYAANKQFIAGLPIRVPAGTEASGLDSLGRSLHDLTAQVAAERGAFHRWLAATVGASPASLVRRREIAGYETQHAGAVVGALARMRATLSCDPREREIRELVEREHRRSVATLAPILHDLAAREREADERVYELYRLPAPMRGLVDAEYD
jgi:hypothetical protein